MSLGEAPYRFHTTRSSLVLLSARSEATGFPAALGGPYRIYPYPLYTDVRRRGRPPEGPQDLGQGFFSHRLRHKTLEREDRVKGKIRPFLLGSLQTYPRGETRRAGCLKRGGGVEFVLP